nr:MAG TPA: terminase small subunit [Caudoviricetes sp.]
MKKENVNILEKDERIKKEFSRLKKLYKDLPEDRKKIAEKLLERAAFMAVSLSEMEETINVDGNMVTMPQGDYEIDRAHPLLTVYNAMIKNYAAVIKQLDAFLTGAGGVSKPGAELLGWLGSGNGQKKR